MSKRGFGSLVVGMVGVVVMSGCLQPPAPGDVATGSPFPSGSSPAPACTDSDLGAQLPVDTTGTTAGGVAAAEPATCGDGEATPAQGYAWVAPAVGVYRVAVTASFPVTLDVVQGWCEGPETGCDAAETTNAASLDVPLLLGSAIDIVIGGEGGATGTYELTIQREPDRCGDSVCEADEDATSCPSDCAAATSSPDPDPDPSDGSTCGDGVCDPGEDVSCPSDCTSTSSSFCGDGTCDAGEDSDSCPSDCGAPSDTPSCDPDDPDCF